MRRTLLDGSSEKRPAVDVMSSCRQRARLRVGERVGILSSALTGTIFDS